MKQIIVLLLIATTIGQLVAQNPIPADAQDKTIALVGATAHIGNGEVIENSVIIIEKGIITEISTTDKLDVEKENKLNDSFFAEIVDVSGKHVYPGFIAPNTQLGIKEIDAIRPTRDNREVGSMNPNVRSIIAYSTDSRVTPTIKSNGILLADIAPQGGLVSGTSSLVSLDAWNWEDAAVAMDHAIYMNWPALHRRRGWWAEPGGIEENKNYSDRVIQIYSFLDEVQSYFNTKYPENTDLKLESAKGLFDGSKQLFIRVNGAREILAAIDVKKKYGISIVIVGGKESWQITEMLVENEIPVILGPIHSLPSLPEYDVDQSFKTPYLLQQAGVTYCLSLEGGWEQRNLPFLAGTAAAHGLTKEEALAAITLNTAKILKVDKLYGSIEKGKNACLIVSTGDVLDMRTSTIEKAYISGRELDLSNKQKALYQRFKAKYDTAE